MNKDIAQVIDAFLPYIVQIVFYACICVVIGYCSGAWDKKVSNLDRILIENSDEFNKKCPIMVDRDTRLDNVEYQSPNLFQFNYTLVNYSKEEIDVEQFKINNKKFAINIIKNTKLADVKFATFYIRYRDKNGDFLFLNEIKYKGYKH